MSHRKHVTIRHKSMIKFVVCQFFLFHQNTSRQCVKSQFVAGHKYSGVPSCRGSQKTKQKNETKNLTCIKTIQSWKFFTFKLVVMVESAANRLSVLAVCMCVQVCECAFWNWKEQNTATSITTHTYTYTHTSAHVKKNGWKNLLRPHPQSQGNPTKSVVPNGVTCGWLGCVHLPPDSGGLQRAA